MTDKEQFDNNKKQGKYRKSKLKMSKFLKADVNRKLMFEQNDEATQVNLLRNLQAIEIEEVKVRRNKHSSSAYLFKPVDKKNLGFNL